MKKQRFTEEQIIAVLKEQEAGAKAADLCRKHGISEATFYNWKAKYGGMEVSEAKRLKALEDENARLKKLLAEQMLDAAALRELLAKKMVGPAAKREAVTHLKAVMGLSERRACQIISADRKTVRYRSCRPPEVALRAKLRDLANERRRFGYRRLFVLLRREGEPSGVNRIEVPNLISGGPASMYPRRNQPRDDDSREVSEWIEGVTGAFDTDAWIREYNSQRRDVEQDLSDLRLGSHDSDAGDRVPRRRSVGGSMRVTPQSLAPENSLSGARHSIDVSRAGSSSLRFGGSGSKTSSNMAEAGEVAAAPQGKRRGFTSRMASGFKKAFGLSSGKTSSRSSGQQDVDAATETHVVSTKARVGAKRGRPADRDMHPDDETRINQFAEAVRNYEILPDGSVGRGDGRVPEATVENNLGILRRFARWLRAENRDSMASRFLNDPDSLAG
ncbi:transposase, partial [Rhizobium phaseoli]